jgi:hypothetical protein
MNYALQSSESDEPRHVWRTTDQHYTIGNIVPSAKHGGGWHNGLKMLFQKGIRSISKNGR